MSLNDGKVGALIAVADMARAVEFYEGKLGLGSGGDDPDGGRTYECGGGTTLHVFEQYGDGPFATDENGLARTGDRVGAWVKDPDGNVLGIGNQ